METKITEEREQTSIGTYQDTWNNHVETLGRLSWNLTYEEQKQLRKIQIELTKLVNSATKDLIKSRKEDN